MEEDGRYWYRRAFCCLSRRFVPNRRRATQTGVMIRDDTVGTKLDDGRTLNFNLKMSMLYVATTNSVSSHDFDFNLSLRLSDGKEKTV